ncbi:hypothetical protein [Streptomyces umbrinus]|nr:hypothetical protein [Streptomyces umbrinus]
MRERSDAATYSVPIKRKKIVPTKTTVPAKPFRLEPALAEAHYEAALEVLRNQRNALELAPGTSAKMGEEEIRNLLLIGLNSHFEGQAADEVFNNTGKTDILIRVLDTLRIKFGRIDSSEAPNTGMTERISSRYPRHGRTGCPCENHWCPACSADGLTSRRESAV